MDCNTVSSKNLAERYLVGDLDPGLQEEYERHYFECDACYSDLQRLTAIREALRTAEVESPVPVRTARAWKRPPAWITVTALAASMGVVAILVARYAQEDNVPVAVSGSPASLAPVPAAPDAAPAPTIVAAEAPAVADSGPPQVDTRPSRTQLLTRLARVEPPTFSPLVLRGSQDEASQLFRDGMKAYVAGNYAAATPVLTRASAADESRPDIAFYLAASQLMERAMLEAEAGFRAVIARGDTPFLGEAHFYLAKVHLARGDVESARTELEQSTRQPGPQQHEAVRLLTELEQLGTK